jgi:DNA repair protein RAD50
MLTRQAGHVSRTEKEVRRLTQEISNLEQDLSVTGSIKTADDVQTELEELSGDMYARSYFLFFCVC